MVGTVIDPDMANTIRVTVVATGLGKGIQGVVDTTDGTIKPLAADAAAAGRRQASEEEAQVSTGPDYRKYETPPKVREEQQQKAVGHDAMDPQEGFEKFDIPAFLRRQAD